MVGLPSENKISDRGFFIGRGGKISMRDLAIEDNLSREKSLTG